MLKIQFASLATSLLALTGVAQASHLGPDGILRNDADQSMLQFNQSAALNACPKGTHLASVREAAKIGHVYGAKGILETSEVQAGVPDGYNPVNALNADQKADQFYYNYNNYVPPQGDLGQNTFWTASTSSDSIHSGMGYVMDGTFGGVGLDTPGMPYPVICLSNQ